MSEVAKFIKTDPQLKDVTEKMRTLTDQDERSVFKRNNFDYVTFSGTFSTRKTTAIISYSGLIVIDFDHVNVDNVREILLNQKEVDTVMLFISPSGEGIKWIVPSTTKVNHPQVFRMYQRLCKDKFGLDVDESGKDIARACFIPYDQDVVYNLKFEFRLI